jgi:sulfur carrier protein ThiS
MKITVKMSGMFKSRFPDQDPHQGIDVEIPEGSKVSDLLIKLGIGASDGATVIADGRVLSIEEMLTPGELVNLLPIMSGG